MGGGASSSNRSSQKRKGLPDHVYKVLRKCLLSLPFSPGAIDEQTVNRAAQNAEQVKLLEPQVILTKGQKAKGIYIVLAGVVQVVSSSGSVVANLSAGNLFGELSTLFHIPCTATVKTPEKVLLLLVRAEVLKTVLKDKVVSCSLMDYFVKKRYLDTSGAVNQSELMHKIAQAVLKEVPLFKHWGDVALQALVQAVQAEGPAVTLAPAQSFIAMEGDPADEIIVIVKGRAEVLKEKEVLSTLQSSRWPVWHGEEALYQWCHWQTHDASQSNGLFTGSRSKVSVRTLSACQLIIIKNAMINEVVKKFKSETVADFTKRLDRWRQRTAGTDPAKTVDAYYRLEVLIQRLSETTLLSEAPLDALYKLAVSSRTLVYQAGDKIIGEGTPEGKQSKMIKAGGSEKPISKPGPPTKIDPTVPPDTKIKVAEASQVFWADDTFLLVLKGAMMLNGNEEWVCSDNQVLWIPKAVLPHSRIQAKTDSVILRFTGSALDEACGDFPEVTLTVPSAVR